MALQAAFWGLARWTVARTLTRASVSSGPLPLPPSHVYLRGANPPVFKFNDAHTPQRSVDPSQPAEPPTL